MSVEESSIINYGWNSLQSRMRTGLKYSTSATVTVSLNKSHDFYLKLNHVTVCGWEVSVSTGVTGRRHNEVSYDSVIISSVSVQISDPHKSTALDFVHLCNTSQD